MQIIDAYYNSAFGLPSSVGNNGQLTACSRYDNYDRFVDRNRLVEAAVTFGLEYRNHLALPWNENNLRSSIELASEELSRQVKILKQGLLIVNRNMFINSDLPFCCD